MFSSNSLNTVSVITFKQSVTAEFVFIATPGKDFLAAACGIVWEGGFPSFFLKRVAEEDKNKRAHRKSAYLLPRVLQIYYTKGGSAQAFKHETTILQSEKHI